MFICCCLSLTLHDVQNHPQLLHYITTTYTRPHHSGIAFLRQWGGSSGRSPRPERELSRELEQVVRHVRDLMLPLYSSHGHVDARLLRLPLAHCARCLGSPQEIKVKPKSNLPWIWVLVIMKV
ncbi:hypothetical protein U1Q18_040911 [Sarracenia purpurea var. burkii]